MADQSEKADTGTLLFVGNTVRDLVFYMDSLPAAASKYRATALLEIGGGMAANAAVAAARLGAKSSLVSRVGAEDSAGLLAELEHFEVDCSRVERHSGHFSTTSAILVDSNGERMIVTCSDQHMPVDSGNFPQTLPEGALAILGDIRWDEAVEHYFTLGRAAGIPVVLDADRAPSSECLEKLASHVIYSAQAASELTGLNQPEMTLATLRGRTEAWIAVTDGARGTWFMDGGGAGHIPAPKIKAIDSLGAGDVYHGAFTLALAAGLSDIDAVVFASAAAAIKCATGGGRNGFPQRADVDAFLAQDGSDNQIGNFA